MSLSFPAILLSITLTASGCAAYRPVPITESVLLKKAQEKRAGEISVLAAVLSAQEAKTYFGVPMAHKNMQPVWLKIRNDEKEPYLFLQQSVDPNYYSPQEAAYINHYSTGKRFLEYGLLSLFFFPLIAAAPVYYVSAVRANRKMDVLFEAGGIQNNMLMPGETVSGFVFTPLDEGTKEIEFSLYSDQADRQFHFFINVPGIHPDYAKRDFEHLYVGKEVPAYSEKDLAAILEQLPPCVSDKKNRARGDPLNLVVIGEMKDILTSFAAAHWDETEALNLKTGWRMFRSFLLGKSYRYSPISPLYLYGRPQDLALQKTRENINQRLHLRLWLAPMRSGGRPVWVGTVSRDIGVRFTLKTWYLTTHKIDSNIDDAREYVLGDIASVKRLEHFGFVKGVGASTKNAPAKNLTGDPYFTDGMRTVLEVAEHRVEPKSFDWQFPEPDVRQQATLRPPAD
jgi:hypothetical protein